MVLECPRPKKHAGFSLCVFLPYRRNVFSDSHQRQRAEESGQKPNAQDDEVHLKFRNKAKLRILAGSVAQLVKVPHGDKEQLWVTA